MMETEKTIKHMENENGRIIKGGNKIIKGY